MTPFRRATEELLDAVETEPIEKIVAIPRLVMGSHTLRERLFLGWEQEAAALTPAIAEALELEPDDLVAAVMARTLAWTHRLIFRAAFSRLLAGEDQRDVASALRVDAARAYDKLQRGFA